MPRPLLLVLGLIACRPPADPSHSATRTLTIVATNDFHGGLYEQIPKDQPDLRHGGLPWIVGAVDALRTEAPDLVLLDGGDVFQGDWPVNATKGRGAVDALDLIGVDAAAIGNHEFDYGPATDGSGSPRRGALEAGIARSKFQWLSANVADADGAPWRPDGLAAWTLIERDGVRLAVIGLTTQDTPQTTLLRHVDDLVFTDVVAAVQAVLPEVERADPDVVALVGHLTGNCEPTSYFVPGEPCKPEGEIGRLLTELPRGTFDVMVLGHAHTVLAHRYEDTFLLENRYRGHALGRVDLVIGPDGVDLDASRLHAPWPIEHPPADPGCEPGEYDLTPRMLGERLVTPSAEAVALIDALEAETGSLCAELGCANAHLWRARDKESPAGDFMADAMRHTFPTADLAVANSGGVRADLPAGVVRREHLQAMMPFDNRLLLVELRGADLDALLTIGSSGGHGLLQVSGATYAFDPERTTGEDRDADGAIADWERDRLCSAAVGGAPIDPDRAYRVVVTDFLLGGGDHLGGPLANARVLEEGPLLREALYDAMSARGGECLGAVIDESAPRIRVGACGD